MTATREQLRQQELETAVGDGVIGRLGRPPGLHHVQSRKVFGNHYRVNVFVGDNSASTKVAHSFFLEADGGGEILLSNPALVRVYDPGDNPAQGAG